VFHSLKPSTLWSTGAVGVIVLAAVIVALSTSGGAGAGTARAHARPAVATATAATAAAYQRSGWGESSTRSAPGAAAAATRISVRSTSAGKILVAPNGHTLYAFTRDTRNRDNCVMIPGCTRVWPLETTRGHPVAGSGVRASQLSTIKVGHVSQVTYAGHPLYTYVSDTSAGSTDYIGVSQFGGTWPAVKGSGALVN